ncbi:hypothetical protein BJY52DRAFT_1211179 [Lactarius psammicola]|nr:hypothetical protein BJY52DRAFT_1211179 [Lactarius psammicola]
MVWYIAPALEDIAEEVVTEVLPALHLLCLEDNDYDDNDDYNYDAVNDFDYVYDSYYEPVGSPVRFLSLRQLSGRPMDIAMPRRTMRRGDPERGERLSLGEGARSETLGRRLEPNSGARAMHNSPDGPSLSEAQSERRDFDDGANALWSLYGKEAQTHDEALFQGLLADMNGVPTFAGLFAAVLTSFFIDSLQNLQPDPAQQSVYYQQQSVAMLAQISQQISSIAPQVSVSSTPPPPYPEFRPSFTDVQVNIFWLMGLVLSLSAALFATLVQQWVRSYMQVFQRYDHPLKRARLRQFFFDGAWSVRALALSATSAIRVSLFLFFFGLSISILDINIAFGAFTIVCICSSVSIYLVLMYVTLWNLQLPDKSLLWPTYFLRQIFKLPYFGNRSLSKKITSMGMEACQEWLAMEETDDRKCRDVRAIRWLINRTAASAEMEPLVLAIPGSFNTEWGQDIWREASSKAHDTLEPLTGPSPAGTQVSHIPYPPHPLNGVIIDTISRCVRHLFETCNNHSYFENEGARRRRMRACVEATASLVCCIDFRLDWFGEVGKLVSEIGHIEKINSPTTTSDPLFIIRWTCLSLMDIQRILGANQLQVLAGYAVNGLVRFQHEQPDEAGREGAQRIEECLKTAWECIEDLRRAFEPRTKKRTREQVEEILRSHERQISELERIKVEADGMKDVDRQISLYQDAMDNATFGLTRQLPGVTFDDPHRSESFLISDTFSTLATGSTPVTPQLIFPGQQVQALVRLGLKLREVLDGQVAEGYEEVLESLKFVDRVPVSLRRPNGLMRRQLWRLQDLCDGGGLGFTVELFFLSLRQLLLIPSSYGPNSVFYVRTFKIITSHWMGGRKSLGTQGIILDIICDLIIRGRGVFSDFSCPDSITTMLLDMIGNMLQGYAGPDEHIRDAVREIECADLDEYIRDTVQEIENADPIRMDRRGLQHRALAAITRSRSSLEHLDPIVVHPAHIVALPV